MELVGDTEFVIELFMVVDVVVKLLFVMEVKIVWLSSALETLLPLVTDASNPWLWCCDVTTLLLLLVLLFWMLLCRTAPFSAFVCYKMPNNSRLESVNKRCDMHTGRDETNLLWWIYHRRYLMRSSLVRMTGSRRYRCRCKCRIKLSFYPKKRFARETETEWNW